MSRADSALRDRMIFVVGAPRSGTYWLQRILAAHPEVAAVPAETFLFSELGLGPLFNRFHHGALDSPEVGRLYLDREVLLDSSRDLCDRVFEQHLRAGKRLLAERTPLFGDYVSLLTDIYPDGRIAHIVRDGRDVARSIVAQSWGPSTVGGAAATWRDAVVAGRRARSSVRFVETRYERLLAEPEASVRELFECLELPVSSEAVEQATAEAHHHLNIDPSAPRVAQEKWQESFDRDDLRAFEAVAGDLLDELGYDRSAVPQPASVSASARARRRLLATAHAARLGHRPRRRSGDDPENTTVAALDSLLGLVHEGSAERIEKLVDPNAAIRIVAGEERMDLRGAAARAALGDALRRDEVMRGRQVRGDVLTDTGSITSVMTYELSDGSRADRVVTLSTRHGRVHRLNLYQFPPRRPAGPDA